ncbi:MAG: hypothetical protein CL868_14620 [Cytophagaceae bacterium]|nr:hypothetical protein [Cytophagaceae bacterium]
MRILFFRHINFEIQSTFVTVREVFVGKSFALFSKLYVHFKKNKPWGITIQELLDHKIGSLGHHLGCFLLQHKFNPQPKCEDHDVFHVLTTYSTDTADEIAMQFYLHGNGKRSPFLNLALACGLLFYMDKYSLFFTAHHKGSQALPIYLVDYSKILDMPLQEFREKFKLT